ncbi:15-hydroxyprostaglandin dehydrogenase [NAD(+)]-like [Amphiura filiformis]|uniref:15-hydroxyprostaglandin dehydrogenase [NAD(+)]-like n=1 Tax=Amphiura filiformis TaxID=82378 RepID=UPI003B2109CB
MDIAGKVSLVTGGASGIGKAMVEIMLRKQAKGVFIVDVNEDAMKQTQVEFNNEYGVDKVHICKCDVTSYEQMEECFKKVIATYGALHIVCNVAGILNEIKWERMLQINLNGVIIGTKLAVQYMEGESCGGGVIVNTSSRAGLALVPFEPIYTTSKYAIIGFSRQVATFDPLVVKKKIRVNVICPCRVETPLLGNLVTEKQYQEILDTLLVDPVYSTAMKTTAQEMAGYFVKLIEEPHHNQTMYVPGSKSCEFIEDTTKAFRQRTGLEETYMKLLDAAI